METEQWIKKFARHVLRIDIMLVVAFALIGILGVKMMVISTKTTNAMSEIAQKVGVDFPTKTNSVFGVWKVVRPL